jgi:hypothetical protein
VINEAIWLARRCATEHTQLQRSVGAGRQCADERDPPARPDEIARRISPSIVLTRPLRLPFLRPDLSLMHASARPNATRRHPSPWPGCHPPLQSNSQQRPPPPPHRHGPGEKREPLDDHSCRQTRCLTVRHTRSLLTVRLPSEYVHESTGLGYATTIHAAQGVSADTMHGLLTGQESRRQLYTTAETGQHPIRHLQTAAAGRDLRTAGDMAAVLYWRLPELAPVDPGPLPWLPGIPETLRSHPGWGPYLTKRSQLVADLADQIQDHACQGETEPIWTPSGSHPSTALVGDIAVRRAANGINPQDP